MPEADSGQSVRDVLAAHFITWHDLDIGGPRGEWRCSCGLKFGFSDSAIDHVTEQVGDVHERGFEAGYEQACEDYGRTSAAIAADALREAADTFEARQRRRTRELSEIHPWTEACVFLRARADEQVSTPGLHACVECGLELDADDLNSVCEDCLAGDLAPSTTPEVVIVAPGQTIDLLGALQRSLDAAKADRANTPVSTTEATT